MAGGIDSERRAWDGGPERAGSGPPFGTPRTAFAVGGVVPAAVSLVSVDATDVEDARDHVDAIAGSEFVDDRIRRQE